MIYSKWKILEEATQDESNRLSASLLEASILKHRNITNTQDKNNFLNPPSSYVNDPLLMSDMSECIDRIMTALNSHEHIGIFGDFDTDGLTGTALLTFALRDLGGIVFPYIPHRVEEGHGVSNKAITYFKDQKVSLIITVDCGITSFKEINDAKALSIDTIITDHHTIIDNLPDALAIVNASHPNYNYPFQSLTGVGTAFKVVEALYDKLSIETPPVLFAYAALGTISDVAPMIGENRYLVSEGLEVMRSLPISGLDALIGKSKLRKNRLTSQDMAFSIIPKLNVAGRIEHAAESLNLLLSENKERSIYLSTKLDNLNKKRQIITEVALKESIEQINKANDKDKRVMFVGKPSWIPGILGLVAARISEQYYRPTIAASGNGEIIRASARTIPEFNLIESFKEFSHLFERFGGHAMAAGFTIKRENLKIFRESMATYASQNMNNVPSAPTLELEYTLDPSEINRSLLNFVYSLDPFGSKNPVPIFITRDLQVVDARTVGSQGEHLKTTLEHGGRFFDAIAFRDGHRVLECKESIDIAFTPTINYWNGRESIELLLKDFRKSQPI